MRDLIEELQTIGAKLIILRWLMMLTYQFVGIFETVIPPKMNGYKKIQRAIQSPLKLGTNNMLQRIMLYKWGEIQDKYSKKIGRTKGTNWNGNASKAFLTFFDKRVET